jgi:RNA polymerase sigma-70 factor (ECF subfamily)
MMFPRLTAEEQTDLVAAIRSGEPAAEGRLVDVFSAAIKAMTRVRTRGKLDVEDVCQDVLIAALTALRRGQLRDAERLGAFVAGIARNVINNQLRSRASRPVEPLTSDDIQIGDLREELARRDHRRMLRDALEDVRPDDRRILVLSLVHGLKSGEVAERLALDPEVVRARKSRALRKLTDRLRKT